MSTRTSTENSLPSAILPEQAGLPITRVTPPVAMGVVLGILAAAIWGLMQASARAAVEQGLSPYDLAALRYGVSGACLAPWLLHHGVSRPSGMGWTRAMTFALLLGPLFFMANVGGYHFAPLAHGAVIFPAMFTIVAAALAAIVLGEGVTTYRIAGIAIIVAGLATISGPAILNLNGQVALGDLMFVVASLMWAVAATFVRLWKVSPMQTTATVAVLSAAIYVPMYLVVGTPTHLFAASAISLLLQGLVHGVLVGVFAVLAFTRSVELLGPSRAAVYPALIPVFGILLGIPLAGEWPTSGQFAGLIIVTIGLMVANIPARAAFSD